MEPQSQSHCSKPGDGVHLGNTTSPTPPRTMPPGAYNGGLDYQGDWKRSSRPGQQGADRAILELDVRCATYWSPRQPRTPVATERVQSFPDDFACGCPGSAPRCRLDPRRSWRQWHRRPRRRRDRQRYTNAVRYLGMMLDGARHGRHRHLGRAVRRAPARRAASSEGRHRREDPRGGRSPRSVPSSARFRRVHPFTAHGIAALIWVHKAVNTGEILSSSAGWSTKPRTQSSQGPSGHR